MERHERHQQMLPPRHWDVRRRGCGGHSTEAPGCRGQQSPGLINGRQDRLPDPGLGSLWKGREIVCSAVLQGPANTGMTPRRPFQERAQVSGSQRWGQMCGKSHTAGPGSKAHFTWVETLVFVAKQDNSSWAGRVENRESGAGLSLVCGSTAG